MSDAVQITLIICGTLITCVGIILKNLRHNETYKVSLCENPVYKTTIRPGTKSEKSLGYGKVIYERKEVNGMEVVEQSSFVKGYSKEPLKKNKNRRIQKKWIKKYGFKPIPDPQIYVINNKIMGHPETIRKMLKEIPDL
jgi:hypothetical protein